MKEVALVLQGVVPAKKNSRMVAHAGMRLVNLPNPLYTAWHRRNLALVLEQRGGDRHPLRSPCRVEISVEYPDLHRRDLDNAVSSIFDLLVDAHVLRDDAWVCVPEVFAKASLRRGEPARAVVRVVSLLEPETEGV